MIFTYSLLQYTNIRACVSRNSKQIANWMKCVPSQQCQIFRYTLQTYVYMKYYTQWIGLREKLQETMVFTIKLVGVSCKFSHHPILSNSMIHIVSSCFIKHILLGGFKQTWIIFHFIYAMSSFPLTKSIIFQRGRLKPPTRFRWYSHQKFRYIPIYSH
jgi:uncharacterized protein YpbB